MEDNHQKQAEEMEQEAKYKIIQMEDETDEKGLLDDTKEEISKLYRDFRTWLSENIDSEDLNARYEKLKMDTADLINKGKAKTAAFVQRDDVQKAKDMVVGAGEKVVDGINDGVHVVMGNEHVSKAVDTIVDTIESVKQDERVKEGVKKFKKGTLKIAESAFNGLKKVLDTDKESD